MRRRIHVKCKVGRLSTEVCILLLICMYPPPHMYVQGRKAIDCSTVRLYALWLRACNRYCRNKHTHASAPVWCGDPSCGDPRGCCGAPYHEVSLPIMISRCACVCVCVYVWTAGVWLTAGVLFRGVLLYKTPAALDDFVGVGLPSFPRYLPSSVATSCFRV